MGSLATAGALQVNGVFWFTLNGPKAVSWFTLNGTPGCGVSLYGALGSFLVYGSINEGGTPKWLSQVMVMFVNILCIHKVFHWHKKEVGTNDQIRYRYKTLKLGTVEGRTHLLGSLIDSPN